MHEHDARRVPMLYTPGITAFFASALPEGTDLARSRVTAGNSCAANGGCRIHLRRLRWRRGWWDI